METIINNAPQSLVVNAIQATSSSRKVEDVQTKVVQANQSGEVQENKTNTDSNRSVENQVVLETDNSINIEKEQFSSQDEVSSNNDLNVTVNKQSVAKIETSKENDVVVFTLIDIEGNAISQIPSENIVEFLKKNNIPNGSILNTQA